MLAASTGNRLRGMGDIVFEFIVKDQRQGLGLSGIMAIFECGLGL